MLLHQFILVAVGAIRRFESALLSWPASLRGLVTRAKIGRSDMQEM